MRTFKEKLLLERYRFKLSKTSKNNYILPGDTMDLHDKSSISIEYYQNMHIRCSLKSDIYSIDEIIDDCAMSENITEDLIGNTPCRTTHNHKILPGSHSSKTEFEAQSTCYNYEQYFGRTIETYPVFFEWILKKTADKESSTDLNKVTEHDVFLLGNYKSDDSSHSTDSKSSTSLSSSKSVPKLPDSPASSILDPKPPTETKNNKECPIPCVRELQCPKFAPCPPDPPNDGSSRSGGSGGVSSSGGFGGSGGSGSYGGHGGKPPRDPENVQLQCTTRNINFKLNCTKVPPGCEHPEGTYECVIVDEGKFVDSKDLEACDLKCREIHFIHSDYDITVKEAVEDANAPIMKEKKPPTKGTTLICSKNGVNFSLECASTVLDPDNPSNVQFICGIGKIPSDEIFNTTIKCKEMCNIIDDSVLDSTDSYEDTQLFINNTRIVEKDDCPLKNFLEENNKKPECYNCVEEGALESPVCYNINDINEKQKKCFSLTKLIINNIECRRKNSNPNESADCFDPEDEQLSTIIERLQCSFKENHNKTMNVLKTATNDLLCKIMKRGECPCWKMHNDGNKFECLDAATESCINMLETVCVTTKSICKFTRQTIDDYIGSEEKPKPEEPSDCKLRKTSGTTEDFITTIKDSAKQIINDTTCKKNTDDEKLQPNDKIETIINSATKIFNNIKKISQEEFDTVKTMNTLKESCINFIDETSKILSDKTIDSPGENEPSKVQGYVKEVMSGLIVFQDEDETKTFHEENLITSNWPDSLHSILTSLSNTFVKLEPADSPENDTPPTTIHSSKSEESYAICNMFATLKEKLCSIFQDNTNETTYPVDSALADQTDNE